MLLACVLSTIRRPISLTARPVNPWNITLVFPSITRLPTVVEPGVVDELYDLACTSLFGTERAALASIEETLAFITPT